MYSTVAIVAVSVLMHLAFLSYKKLKFARFRKLLTAGFVSALVFLGLQYYAWLKLTSYGYANHREYCRSVYLFSLVCTCVSHIVVGLLVTAIFLLFAFKARKDTKFEFNNIANPDRLLHMELLVYFWHFIDIVWIYLYFFFYFNYQ
jgi:cytochrome c oxidase subunit 3